MSQKINVNETPGPISPTLYFSQGDIGRVFTLEVVSSEGYTIPPGATVECVGTKPSGFGFSVPCTYTDNTVTLVSSDTEGQNFTDEAGRFRAELVITDGSDVIGTANFYMESERNPHPDGTIDGEAEQTVPILTQLVTEIENIYNSMHALTVSAVTLEPGEDATATYDPVTNEIVFGIPRGSELQATDEDSDGNIVITFN